MTSAIAGFRTSEKQRDKHENTRYTAAVAAAPQQTAARNKLLPTTGQVQNVANSRVYVFGNSDLAEDELNSVPSSEDFIEMSELRPRAGKVKNKKKNVDQRKEAEPIFIEREIESGDSLQIFSLQYGCPVIIVLLFLAVLFFSSFSPPFYIVSIFFFLWGGGM